MKCLRCNAVETEHRPMTNKNYATGKELKHLCAGCFDSFDNFDAAQEFVHIRESSNCYQIGANTWLCSNPSFLKFQTKPKKKVNNEV